MTLYTAVKALLPADTTGIDFVALCIGPFKTTTQTGNRGIAQLSALVNAIDSLRDDGLAVKCVYFDYMSTRGEIEFIRRLGITYTKNLDGFMKATTTPHVITVFLLPLCPFTISGNVLRANWVKKRLGRLIIVGAKSFIEDPWPPSQTGDWIDYFRASYRQIAGTSLPITDMGTSDPMYAIRYHVTGMTDTTHRSVPLAHQPTPADNSAVPLSDVLRLLEADHAERVYQRCIKRLITETAKAGRLPTDTTTAIRDDVKHGKYIDYTDTPRNLVRDQVWTLRYMRMPEARITYAAPFYQMTVDLVFAAHAMSKLVDERVERARQKVEEAMAASMAAAHAAEARVLPVTNLRSSILASVRRGEFLHYDTAAMDLWRDWQWAQLYKQLPEHAAPRPDPYPAARRAIADYIGLK